MAWTDAAIASRVSKVLTVDALVAGLDDTGGCGFIVKPHVSETSKQVAIHVQVFTRPLPPNQACADSAVVAEPATVSLSRALGNRSLVDSTGSSPHQVLVVDQTPTLTKIPARYVRKTTGWDESRGYVGEWWRWQTHGQSSQIDLDFGPPAALAKYDAAPADAHRGTVAGSPALVWTDRTGDLLTSTVTWSVNPERDVRLTLLDESSHPPSETTLLALANSFK